MNIGKVLKMMEKLLTSFNKGQKNYKLELILFNLVFITIPLLIIIGAVIGLFAWAGAMIIVGIAAIIGMFVSPIFSQFINVTVGISLISIIYLGIATSSLGILIFRVMCNVYKFLFTNISKYISLNVELLNSKKI